MFEYLVYFDIFIRACACPFIRRRPAGGYWWLFHVVFLNQPVYGPLEFVASWLSLLTCSRRGFHKGPQCSVETPVQKESTNPDGHL